MQPLEPSNNLTGGFDVRQMPTVDKVAQRQM